MEEVVNSSLEDSSQCSNSTQPGPLLLIPVFFSIITVCAVVGNSLVIYTVAKNSTMHNVTNFYILNVAITDLFFVVVCAPITASLYIIPTWIFGNFVCKAVAYTQFVSVQATCATLTAMTVDRYCAIISPIRSRTYRTTRTATLVSISIWIVSFLIHSPTAIYFEVVDLGCSSICRDEFPSENVKKGHQVYATFVTYLLPLSIIAVSYAFVLRNVWAIDLDSDEHNGAERRCSVSLVHRKRRVTKMVLIVVILFAVSWGPLHAINLWIIFDPNYRYLAWPNYLRIFCLCLAYSNSCVNPFVYAFAGNSFRKHFKKILRISSRRRSTRRLSSNSTELSQNCNQTTLVRKKREGRESDGTRFNTRPSDANSQAKMRIK